MEPRAAQQLRLSDKLEASLHSHHLGLGRSKKIPRVRAKLDARNRGSAQLADVSFANLQATPHSRQNKHTSVLPCICICKWEMHVEFGSTRVHARRRRSNGANASGRASR